MGNFRFIVVNNIDNPVPLVWEFSGTQEVGTIEIGHRKFRDPEVIGKELTYYLNEHPKVPSNISLTHPNNIEEWFENRK
jgi:hypothetical protein